MTFFLRDQAQRGGRGSQGREGFTGEGGFTAGRSDRLTMRFLWWGGRVVVWQQLGYEGIIMLKSSQDQNINSLQYLLDTIFSSENLVH